MQRSDLITRGIAAFIDLLLILALTRLPDVLGVAAAVGYVLLRDGILDRRSIGKRLLGLHVAPSEGGGETITHRESIIRNSTLAVAYLLFLIPYIGWIPGTLVIAAEGLAAAGDDRGMRIGDLIARTWIVLPVVAVETPPQQTAQSEVKDGETAQPAETRQ